MQATDTDIFIMAIYYSVCIPGLKELWMQKGSSYIPCHIIANLLAEKFTLPVTLVASALLCGHIMSGCDTISYVLGKGKEKSFKVAMAIASDLTEMMQFGDDTHDVTEAVTDVCRNFFLKLYGDFSGNLDKLRAHVRTYQGRYQETAPNRECLQVPHDYHLQESSYVHTFLTWCYIIWTEHCAWPFGFHYDGQTGEAFVCQTQELLSV